MQQYTRRRTAADETLIKVKSKPIERNTNTEFKEHRKTIFNQFEIENTMNGGEGIKSPK